MAILGRFNKQPAETKRYVVDYSDRLQSSETIASVAGYTVTPTTITPLTVSHSVGAGATTVVLYVGGGEDNNDYTVELQVTTSDTGGVLWEDEIIYVVEEIS